MASLSRRAFVGGLVGLGASLLAGGRTERAVAPSPSPRPRRIGGLFSGFPRVDSGIPFREALAELGYVDGRDYVLEYRYASIGANTANRWRLMADLIDKIFKGTNPGDLPVAQNHVFDIGLNLSMARKIGLSIPVAFMRRVSEVVQ